MSESLVKKTAVISDCKKYRYRLTREWADGPLLVFVMLNPSTADADIDDPTIRRCVGFAKRECYQGIEVVNLFAFRSTNPKYLKTVDNPYGHGNFDALGGAILGASLTQSHVICAWGAHPIAINAGKALIDRAKKAKVPLFCLGRTQRGFPRHPLYVPANQPMEAFVP